MSERTALMRANGFDLAEPEGRENYGMLIRIMQEQIIANGDAGGRYETTVGAVAEAMQMPVAVVAPVLEEAWLVIVSRSAQPVELWKVEQDGE